MSFCSALRLRDPRSTPPLEPAQQEVASSDRSRVGPPCSQWWISKNNSRPPRRRAPPLLSCSCASIIPFQAPFGFRVSASEGLALWKRLSVSLFACLSV